MKKRNIIHFSFLVSLLVLTSIFKGSFTLSSWPLWAGGILGTILPEVDHLLYIFLLRPYELSSQRAVSMIMKGDFFEALKFLLETRGERTNLICHTAIFQVIFLILTFWVITSSGSLFGKGLVLAFSLHLLVDQAIDLSEPRGIGSWFLNLQLTFTRDQLKIYWILILVVFLLFAFIL